MVISVSAWFVCLLIQSAHKMKQARGRKQQFQKLLTHGPKYLIGAIGSLWHIDHFVGWNREGIHRIHHGLGGLAPHLLDADASFASLSHLLCFGD
jgi:hypothetical protein